MKYLVLIALAVGLLFSSEAFANSYGGGAHDVHRATPLRSVFAKRRARVQASRHERKADRAHGSSHGGTSYTTTTTVTTVAEPVASHGSYGSTSYAPTSAVEGGGWAAPEPQLAPADCPTCQQ